jgi:alkylated DNA repair dioxygenase AlkB
MGSRIVAAPSLDWQASLFGRDEPRPDATFATARRIELGEGAWVDVVPEWLSGADTLFERLMANVAWHEREVPMYEKVVAEPRLSYWWGDGATQPWPPEVRAIARALHRHYGAPFGAVGVNLYRNGADSVALHGDSERRDQEIELGEGAWVDVVPEWLSGADTLFERLMANVAWHEREVPMYEKVVAEPRSSYWWGDGATQPWPPEVRAIARALHRHYGAPFGAVGVNLYRSGADSVAWHGDSGRRDQEIELVAVLSLGSKRRFLLRPTGGGTSVRLDPAPGDLLVMGGTCQSTWQHCVPKSARSLGPRLSVSLRCRAAPATPG